MKKSILFILVIFCQFAGFAQKATNSKDEKAVAARVEEFRQALIDGNGTSLNKLTSKELSYGHSNGVIQNQREFVEKLTNGESDFVTIEFQNQTIAIIDSVAIVRHNLAAHTKDNGVEKDIKIGIMLVWQKQNKEWFLVGRQAFKLPI